MVFTHGRLVSPRSTAFLASSPAPSITEGLDVLVHDVIAAMTTCPWSTFAVLPSSNVTGTGSVGQSWACCADVGGGRNVASDSRADRDRVAGRERPGRRLVESALHRRGLRLTREQAPEGVLGGGQRDPVLGALRPGDRRLHRGQVQLDRLAVVRLVGRVVPQSLLLGVGLDEPDLPFGSAGQPQVGQRLGVDGKDRTGRAVFRAHVADGRAGGQRNVGHARAVEVDELADHPHPAQQLRHREDQIGRGAALPQVAGEPDADDLGDEHAHRLAEHGGFGLDAADAPAQHAQPVDHRGVRVGADQGVRIGTGRGAARAIGGEHDPGQVLEVHLVADAGVRRHDEEVVEGFLRPPQQLVTLLVAVELQVGVAPEGVGAAEDVGDDRVVDDQLGRDERVDPAGVAAEVGHGVTHRDQIHHTGHPGEVLQQHPRRRELNLGAALGRRIPARRAR